MATIVTVTDPNRGPTAYTFDVGVPVQIAAGTAIIGKVQIDQTTPGTTNAVAVDQTTPGTTNGVTVVAIAAGGATPYTYIAAASANQDSQVIKNTAGNIKALVCFCTVATPRYLKLYNKATAPTNADTPVQIYLVPANDVNGAGFNLPLPEVGMGFSAGIAFRMTTGQANGDANPVTAGDLVLDVVYK